MDFEKIDRAARIRQRSIKIITYAFLGFWALVVLFPFYWMVLTSVKSYASYNAEFIPQLFTLDPTWQNYVDAFTAVPLADYFVNTLIFTRITLPMISPSIFYLVITGFIGAFKAYSDAVALFGTDLNAA